MAILNGDNSNNTIPGTDEDDEINGGGGDDTINGGDGDDTIVGGTGNDILDGEGGTDELFGNNGKDILFAGSGLDKMTGGGGKDTFGFYGAGHFEITDFNLDDDCLFFDSEILGVNSVEQLLTFITNVEQDDNGVRVEFLDDAASITLVGINADDITADMIIFTL